MIDLRSTGLSLIDFLPESIASDPEIIALSKAIDPELREVAQAVEEAIIWPRIDELPEQILDVLAYDCRLAELALWDTATVAGKRAILRNVHAVRKRAGTRYAVRRILDLLELTATIIEWWEEGAAAFTYRIRINASQIGVTLDSLQKIPELVQRFAPTRASLTELAAEADSPGTLLIYPALTVGHLTTIPFGGP